MSDDQSTLSLETRLIHAGEPKPRIEGAISMPIFQSATYEPPDDDSGYHGLRYIRLNTTPNHDVLHRKLASLENSASALVTSSGMAAISTTLLTLLRSGDHMLAQNCLYGGTFDLLTKDFPDYGIHHDFIDANTPNSWANQLKPNTKLIYVETLTNPLAQVIDLEAVVEFARQHHLLAVIDNTFASPVNYRPIDHGFDVVLHSATKYLNGHSDIVAGAVMSTTEQIAAIKSKLDHFGGALDPHACFLLHRGLKTLALRIRQQNHNTLALAQMLEQHPKVAAVHYPGLETHPDYQRARRLFAGCGGVLSFELQGPAEQAQKLLARLTIATDAPSLGGVETLITRPAATSHAGLSPTERERLGISDGLIRVAVGIEATEDLLADFNHAIDSIDG